MRRRQAVAGFVALLLNVVLAIVAASARPAGPAPAAQDGAPVPVVLQVIVASSAEEAQRLVDRLNRGEDFAALAKAESIDPTAGAGGLLGTVDVSTLPAFLREALQGVAVGQLSRVVQIPTGFAILKIVEEAAPVATGMNAVPTSAGNVKYMVDVSGLAEAETALQRLSKPAGWEQDPRAICNARTESLETQQRTLEDFFWLERRAAGQTQPAAVRLDAHFALGQLYAYRGRMDDAVDQYREAYRLADDPGRRLELEEALGIAYLHQSEMDNDVYHAPGEMCLLPMPRQAYARTRNSERAVEHFLKYLEQRPDEIEVRWLLNLAYMTLGKYPEEVPAAFLMAPATFETTTHDVGRFRDVAPQAGLNIFATAGGLIVDDFAGDGRFDVVTSNFDSCGPMHYFRNNGDGTFVERTSEAGLDDQLGGLNLIQADYNNDACTDILVLRGGWQTPQRNSLLKNNCDGTFTDVTAASGLARPATSTQTAAWADIDNDGFLDLFVGNENRASQLFLNKGDGTFEDISDKAGINRPAFSKGVAAADYDNDRFVDFYVSNLTGDNFLYRNNGDNTFTEMAQSAGVTAPDRSFATWFFDYDNDGWADLFVTSYYVSVEESVRTYLRLPHNVPTMKLYRNLGNGQFRDVTAEVGLDKVFMPMGANFGDIDNDGFLDIYLGTGNPSYGALVPSVLLRNDQGRSFVDVTASSGTGELHKGHGIAFADLDNDGDQEIVAEFGGAVPGDSHALRLFENPGHGNDWVGVRLVGRKSNRAAIGARLKVTVEDQGGRTRAFYRSVGSGGSFGASPLEQHIGLGPTARIIELEVWWPTSDTRQRLTQIDKNRVVEIEEGTESYRTLERPVTPLGRTRRVE